ncbi:MAG TPA: signal peptidase II [Pseudobdellovibrionaceae bacterium]|nr:signal peptidase II [Pseudobdellovibrionaceae bacterium]
MKLNEKYLILSTISGAIITADQATKMWVHTSFQLHESVEVLPGFFNLTYVRNFGAAFGFLADSHPGFRELFFLSMPPIALLIILAILRGVPAVDRWSVTSLSLVFGGAIGNYIDRLRFRYVIDFLDFHIQKKYVWPAFNIADMAIVVGVGMLLYLELVRGKKAMPEQDKPSTAAESAADSP